MSLFKNLFGKESGQTTANPTHQIESSTSFKTEQELLEFYGGIGLDKQRNLYGLIGDNNWNADLKKGEVSFGENLVFPIQVLGSFSHSSQTWLWAWANKQLDCPEAFLQQALQLKKYGEDNNLNLLKNSDFEADINDLHLIGMIASGLFNSSAYYLADYGQGILVVTVKADAIEKNSKDDHIRVLTVFPELISTFEMNHQTSLNNYLIQKNYSITNEGDTLTATKNGETITAEFDGQHRLTNLKG
ncbi:DUF6882 domain-containing protein [Pedobacter cryoconitis]|uniref:Uncharacterized protein n=1 Tax=Pedobacter cryoconitis TaxID=188932 RepID=A0A7X0J4G7_9SPHI|nr:DUF6882 domain-containing protein [Pedobacter cryoconitis]MBB6500197.1 hypothetical protein [Pedobacter cryoconitis]